MAKSMGWRRNVSEFAFKLKGGKFVVSVEVNPPRSHNFDRLLKSAQVLRDAGADVLNIADSPTARMRVSPWAVCHTLQTRLGIETVLHFPTRGRNLLRIQGDLLGAHALNVRNIFVCMGDPARIGDYPEAMDNYDIVPSALIRLIDERMNVGMDQAGNSLGQPTNFTIGCALNMGAAGMSIKRSTCCARSWTRGRISRSVSRCSNRMSPNASSSAMRSWKGIRWNCPC